MNTASAAYYILFEVSQIKELALTIAIHVAVLPVA
jgi:hypothetical protein